MWGCTDVGCKDGKCGPTTDAELDIPPDTGDEEAPRLVVTVPTVTDALSTERTLEDGPVGLRMFDERAASPPPEYGQMPSLPSTHVGQLGTGFPFHASPGRRINATPITGYQQEGGVFSASPSDAEVSKKTSWIRSEKRSEKSDGVSQHHERQRKILKRSATGISIMSGVQKRLATLEAKSNGVLTSFGPVNRGQAPMGLRFGGIPHRVVGLVFVVAVFTVMVTMVTCLTMALVFEVHLGELEERAEDAQSFSSLQGEVLDWVSRSRVVIIITCLALVGLSLAMGLVMGICIARPVSDVGLVMTLMGQLGFSDIIGADDALSLLLDEEGAPRSRIRDIAELQVAVGRVMRSTEMFARFLPETVVRGIVRGDERATRLHVRRREVSILFSDIKDFTTISESVSQEDLIFLLTRYLSVMTKIVESLDGVVAEILGDGLLVFWNTPDDVEDHAAKACAAALAQVQAVKSLNEEWKPFGLPTIELRIGVNTGLVLTGNIGSESKMKFGCMGDPINLASRLEGLCKFYGTNIICSADTHKLLPRNAGFFCRELDLVQVKGKQEPTRIYELVGVLQSSDVQEDSPRGRMAFSAGSISSVSTDALNASAKALRMFTRVRSNRLMAALMSVGRNRSSPDIWRATSASNISRQASSSATNAFKRDNVSGELLNRVDAEEVRLVTLYERALEEFRQGNFAAAKSLTEDLLAQRPGDLAAERLMERAKEQVANEGQQASSSSQRWTGVNVMTDK